MRRALARGLGATLVGLFGAACADEAPAPRPDAGAPPEPPPLECPADQRPEAGRCVYVLPDEPCPPHTQARVGEAECVPIGAGPCAPPLRADGPWGCAPIAAEGCGPGFAPRLGEAECVPVGVGPCPGGFRAEGAGCRAVVGGGCVGATKSTLGDPGCGAVGACADPVADLHVDPNSPAVDATHFRSLRAAVSAAAAGQSIGLAAGEYGESVRIGRALHLRGRCAAEVSLAGLAIEAPVEVTLAGLTIQGGAGLLVRGGARVSGEALVIDGTNGIGALVSDPGTRLELRGSVIRGVGPLPDGSYGRGVSVEGGGELLLGDSAITDVRDVGVAVVGPGSSAHLDGVVILDVAAAATGLGGHALVAAAGGKLTGARVAAIGTEDIGLLAYLAPSELALDGLEVRETGRGGSGAGARADAGGRLVLDRVTIVEPRAVGVMVDDETSTASVTDAWITNVAPDPSSAYSAGVAGFADARVGVARVVVEDASFGVAAVDGARLTGAGLTLLGRPASIGAYASAAELSLTDSTLSEHPAGAVVAEAGADVRLDSVLIHGGTQAAGPSSGVFADGSTVAIAGSAIVGGTGFGVLGRGAATVLRIERSLVLGQRAGDRVVGHGLVVEGGKLIAGEIHVSGVDGLGVLALGDAELERVTVTGITSSARQNGAALALGGRAVVRDSAVASAQLAGVVLGAGTIDVDGLLILDTAPNDQGEYGHALLGESTSLRARHLELRGSRGAGLVMDAAGAFVERSLIAGNGVGVHAQGESLLVESGEPGGPREVVLAPDVLLLDNATRVGVGVLPLPDPFGLERR